MQLAILSNPSEAMDNNLLNMTVSLTEEDQLALLKDSIDLRFSHLENNEFAQFKRTDGIKQFQFNEQKLTQIKPESKFDIKINKLDLELVEAQKKTKRSLRYICCTVICIALFAPFLNLAESGHSVSGLDLISMLLGLYERPSASLGSISLVTAFPLLLIIYAIVLAFFPKYLNAQKVGAIRAKLWSSTAACGILYFFSALLFFAVSDVTGASPIGYGYYLAMATIFANHFLTQITEQTAQSIQMDR